MWNSLQTPKSEDIEDLLDPSPTGETPDSGALPRILGRQESEESEEDDTDYIPAGLASFVKQIDATLNSTKQGFLTTAAKSPIREPAVFCFDGGSGRAPTPPMEDEDDVGLRNEVMDKFKPKTGDQRFDVQQILAAYGDNAPNDAEEVLFSPDLKTPPPNPHYGMTGTEARRLALESPGLTVDTDVLPIRPPAHDDDSGSSSQMEEPDEPMDPLSWLDSALCDRPTNHATAEKRLDSSSRPTRQAPRDPTAALFHGVSYDLTSPTTDPQNAVPVSKAPPQSIPPIDEINHVGDVDETKLDPPPSSPKRATTPVANVEAPKPPLETEGTTEEEKPEDSIPMEIEVQPRKRTEPEQVVPVEVTVETKTPRDDKPKQAGPPVTNIEIQPRTQKTPTQTPAKQASPPSSTRATTSKQSSRSGFDRLSSPASASKAMSVKQPTHRSTETLYARTPPARTVPTTPSSAIRTSASSKRPIGSTQRSKLSVQTSLSKTTPGTNRASPVLSSDKAARTSTNASPGVSVQSSASKPRAGTVVKRSAGAPSTRTTPPTTRVTRTFKQTQTQSTASGNEHGTSPVLTSHRNSKPTGVSSRLLQETTASKQRHEEVVAEHRPDHVPHQHVQEPMVSSRLLQETTASKHRHVAEEELRNNFPPVRSPSRDAPGPHISSRLLQDTVSSRLHHASTEEALHASEAQAGSPSRDLPAPHLSGRLLQDTTASRQRHAAREEDLHPQNIALTTHTDGSKAGVPSRLLQETTAFKKRLAANVELMHSTPPKAIHSDESKLIASREKAQRRIRLHMAKEKERERALKPSGRSTKISAEEGIARAKERLRQRQLKEQQEMIARGKENFGRRVPPKRPQRPSFVGVKEKQRRPLTIPDPPKFSTSRRQSVRHPPIGSRGSSVESDTRGSHAPVVEMTLAQSTDILRKGLRHDDTSHCSNVSRHRELTIAHAPRFATSARFGEKLPSASWKDATLASSTRLLQNQLRGEDPSVMKKREFKLTVPEAPKFQKSAKRALPKSTAELEDEMMKELSSKPFKARPYRLHTPKSVTAAHKSHPRSTTTSKPFHLATDSRAAAAATTSSPKEVGPKENPDDAELKKKFHARPMPSFANPPQIKKAPRVDPNANQDRSISPPKLRTSDRAGKRLETAQTFSSHADQVRRQKELELKRRQKEKHEEEMRKAETPRAIAATSAPVAPFQLASQSRHENYRKKMEEKLLEEEEEKKKAASFHARQFRPAPAPEQKRERHPPTTPEPFRLKSEQRHSAYEEKNRKKILEAEEQLYQQAQFRARPIPQTTYKSASPSAQQVLLATTARLLAYQEQKKQREEAELEEIRKQSQFKARPVPSSTYEYALSSSPQRSPNASPGRQGFRNNGHHHLPGSSPGREGMSGAENQPIDVDQPPRATSPTRPPVSSIVFQS
eukprot:scaffold1549_cov156-Amphora_coffeaeformis.AAC.4